MILYQDYETEISKQNLSNVFSEISEPLCLLGGWAVYLTVNENYKSRWKRDYHGSKDIDIGFHIDQNQNPKLLQKSTFAKSIKSLVNDGFVQITHHFVKWYHTETRRQLSQKQSEKISQAFMFQHFVDPIVDGSNRYVKEILGTVPIVEPLLLQVFMKKKYHWIKAFGSKIMLPETEVLLGCKLNALGGRTGHKRTKDVADIYALIWYSKSGLSTLSTKLLKILNKYDALEQLSSINDDDFKAASEALGIPESEIITVIKGFIEKVRGTSVSVVESGSEVEKWRIPFSISYEGYKTIITALYRQKADSNYVDIKYLKKILGFGSLATLKMNLFFLTSVNILEGDTKNGFKFTDPLGKKYAKAIFSGDKEQLKESSSELINNSHLRTLAEYIAVKNASMEDILNYVKTEARIPSGRTENEIMASYYLSGARTLLRIFKDAGIINEEIQFPRPKSNMERAKGKLKKKQLQSARTIKSNSIVNQDDIMYHKASSEDLLKLPFGDKIVIMLPKSNTKLWWKRAQQYMELYLAEHESLSQ
jgi:hypothetical protein